jgi:hypothetical protein
LLGFLATSTGPRKAVWNDAPSPVYRASVTDAQDIQDLALPIHIYDRPVISDAELVRLDGTEACQVSGQIHGDLL